VACLCPLCLTSHGLFRLVGVECSLSHFLIFLSLHACLCHCAPVVSFLSGVENLCWGIHWQPAG
jgi:hypothetical protein